MKATSRANAVLVQPDGKIVTVGVGTGTTAAIARFLPDGSHDPTFGEPFGGPDGVPVSLIHLSSIPHPNVPEWFLYGEAVNGAAIQPDGKIVVVGAGDGGAAVARVTTDGSLDPTFADDGATVVDPVVGQEGNAVAIQPDGKIVLVGRSVLARLDPDGTLDASFAGDGTVEASGVAVTLQPDGKIITIGDTTTRWNADGSVDTSFVENGTATPGGAAVAITPDGRIVTARTVYDVEGRGSMTVSRLSSAGSPDQTFAGDGRAELQFGDAARTEAKSVAVQPNGKIVVSGFGSGTFEGVPIEQGTGVVVRLNPDGSPDTSFSGNGIFVWGDKTDARAMVLEPNGPIVVAGYQGEIRRPDFGSTILAQTRWLRIEGGDSQLSAPWSPSLPAATLGAAYSADAVTGAHVGGTPPVTYTATGLPAGLEISTTGSITGIPTTVGSSLVTVTATDRGIPVQVVTQTFNLVVNPALLTVSWSGTLPTGAVGTAYSGDTVTAAPSGGTAPYAFTAAGLPAGLTINTTTGRVTGTPTTAGAAQVSVTVTDHGVPAQTATRSFSIGVNPATPTATKADLKITVAGPATAKAGSSVTYTLTVKNLGPAAAAKPTTAAAVTGLSGITTVPVSATGSTKIGSTTVTGSSWTQNTLASGASVTYTIRGTISVKAGKTVTVLAASASTTSDPNAANNLTATTTKVN